jgi:hypothetical protein
MLSAIAEWTRESIEKKLQTTARDDQLKYQEVKLGPGLFQRVLCKTFSHFLQVVDAFSMPKPFLPHTPIFDAW